MDTSIKIAVVIPNFNGATIIRNAIDSLLEQTMPPAALIVVENGSSDDSLSVLQLYGSKIIILQNKTNLGFAGGVNVGIHYALEHEFDAVALFNSDAIASREWLHQLTLELLRHKTTAIVTGMIQSADGHTIDSTGEFYSRWGIAFPRGRGEQPTHYPTGQYVFGGSGGASLYRTALFRDIGLFDEHFFAYYEDTDISFRAQLAGWRIRYVPTAIVFHDHGTTSKKMPGFTVYQTFKNLPLLYIKNVPGILLLPIGLRLTCLYAVILLNAIRKGNGAPALRGWLAGIWYFLTSGLWQRHSIQRSRRVSAAYIRSIIYPALPPNQAGMRRLVGIISRKRNHPSTR